MRDGHEWDKQLMAIELAHRGEIKIDAATSGLPYVVRRVQWLILGKGPRH